MTIAGVLLAAGGGSRFNGPTHKLLADYRGRPVVQNAVDTLSVARFDASALVMGAVDLTAYCPESFALLNNPDWAEGLASSLQVAIAWCTERGHDAVVIGLGDSPGIPPSAWQAVRDTDADVAVASFSGALRPPVRLTQAVWPDLPRSGDAGARALWHREGTVQVPCEGDPFDIDTIEDLRGATR